MLGMSAVTSMFFDLMNTMNKSTGFSPFQLQLGQSPRLIPPLITPVMMTMPEEQRAWELIDRLEQDVFEVQDNLLKAKVTQATYADLMRKEDLKLDIGDHVMLSTKNRRQQYAAKGEKQVAKFMPRFNGPYFITDINHKTSTVTLDLPPSLNVYPTFHMSEIMPYNENDWSLFPSHELACPGSIITEDGVQEYYIEKIIDTHKHGRGMQYLVQWLGYRPEEDEWLPRSELTDNAALDNWLAGNW
jgi:Chromo (CHRromatin Organisation MOdifier) domain